MNKKTTRSGINKVYLVGAGPGKEDLITLRGFNILKEADTVIYDYLINKSLLKHAKATAELICCGQLAKKGKFSDGSGINQDNINKLMIKKAKQGKKVLRLKNGDPSIFSRCSQELKALVKEKIKFEIVPGVTAASAASCFSGIVLTDRELSSSCTLATGHEDPLKRKSLIDWKVLVKSGTAVLYMGVENLKSITEKIIKAGKDKNTAVAVVEAAACLRQRVLTGTLENIAAKAKREKIKPPAIIIIGKVVKFEKDFNWLNKSKRILFTGLSDERFFTKDIFFHLPLIKIEAMPDYRDFDNYLKNISKFDWIVFTSRFGAKYFFQRVRAINLDSRILSGIKIAAIGNATKSKLLEYGVLADLVPGKESAKGLIEEFKKLNIKNEKIFLPRSDIADKGLNKKLTALGASVSSSYAYRNIMPTDLPDLDLSRFDEIMFTSPSTVRNFKKRYKRVPKGVKISWIGNVTLKEVRRCRLLG